MPTNSPPPSPPDTGRAPASVWSRSRGASEEEGDMDMTPMVDVTFLLLIFFMITAAFALQKAIAVPPVDDEDAASVQTMEELDEDSIVVRIDSDNIFWIVCPSWATEEKAVSKQDMRTYVRHARRGQRPDGSGDAGKGWAKMLVQASGDCTHEFVVAALDAGSGAGVEEISLVKVEDEY